MPQFDLFSIVKWIHFLFVATAGGASIVTLLISGFEDDHEDVRGLAATLWKKVVAWAFRLAVLSGIALLAMLFGRHEHPFDAYYLPIKLVFVLLLLAASEVSTKALALTKRGAPLMALVLFLFTTLVVYNKEAFGRRARPLPPPAEVTAIR